MHHQHWIGQRLHWRAQAAALFRLQGRTHDVHQKPGELPHRYRIRVNQINPGWVLTEGEHYTESVTEGKGEGWLEDALKTRPFGRMLYPEDIAHAALFLATAELLTGAVLDYEQLPVGALPDL